MPSLLCGRCVPEVEGEGEWGGRGLWGERGGSHEQNGVNFYLPTQGFLRRVKAVLSFRDFLFKEIPLCESNSL